MPTKLEADNSMTQFGNHVDAATLSALPPTMGLTNASIQGLVGSGQSPQIASNNCGIPANIQNSMNVLNEAQGANVSNYRDFSRTPLSEEPSLLMNNQSVSSGKEPPFPMKLHCILSNNEFNDVITWLPHGRSWRVLKPKTFEEKVIPLYFRHAKYASFMRQVNGWGFKRITQGPDHNSYYHELFLRGLPQICVKMRRPARSKANNNVSELNPDFYRLNMVAPLPSTKSNKNANHIQESTERNNGNPNLLLQGSYQALHPSFSLQQSATTQGNMPTSLPSLDFNSSANQNLLLQGLPGMKTGLSWQQPNVNPSNLATTLSVPRGTSHSPLMTSALLHQLQSGLNGMSQNNERMFDNMNMSEQANIVRQLKEKMNDLSKGATESNMSSNQQAGAMQMSMNPNFQHNLQQMMLPLNTSQHTSIMGNSPNVLKTEGIPMMGSGPTGGMSQIPNASMIGNGMKQHFYLPTNPLTSQNVTGIDGMNNALMQSNLGSLGFVNMPNQFLSKIPNGMNNGISSLQQNHFSS
eukprot:CAMPEP_0184855234 /NCGR_PEP_ID=MMETSP0580-20130426/536_1 /TAXON_ID=1118495 /ORGANISM="Dactyliosolen fragilissimus" /LENGTH=522 /DNA_ID=CAMNT_0027349693 /DNA_START=174 /DNA_END=1742 /DNA_ORIENTATION=-